MAFVTCQAVMLQKLAGLKNGFGEEPQKGRRNAQPAGRRLTCVPKVLEFYSQADDVQYEPRRRVKQFVFCSLAD